jgi:hypothetical protein
MKKRPVETESVQSLVDMLSLGQDDQVLWPTDQYAGIWRHLLATPLSEFISDDQGCGNTDSSINQVLFATPPDLEHLELLKLYAKSVPQQESPEIPTDLATTLYYVLIAIARSQGHGEFTSLPNQAINEGVEWTLRQTWLDAETRALMEQLRSQRQA